MLRCPCHSLRTAILPCTLFLAVAASPTRAQNAQLLARVVDDQGQPAAGAAVIVGLNLIQLTGADGTAAIRGIPPGVHLVRVQRSGYRTESVLLEFAPGARVEIEAELLPGAYYELEPITVEAERRATRLEREGFYDRRRSGHGTFLDERALERFRHAPDLQMLVKELRGFDVRPVAEGFGFEIFSTRGGLEEQCRPDVFIDGAEAEMRMVETLVPATIEAIEVYSGPATTPARFLVGSSLLRRSCGALVIWTRFSPRRT